MNKLEEKMDIVFLSDFYSSFLTDKQRFILEEYYYNDISLSEIAENLNISRQAVRDTIENIKKTLIEMENKLLIATNYKKTKKIINNIQSKMPEKKVHEISSQLTNIIKMWESKQ